MQNLPTLRTTLCMFMVAVSALFTGIPQGYAKDAVDPDLLNALKWREIGPWRGGRVTTVTGVMGHPQLYYMGATGGGVWKTGNGGVSWENISDDFFNVGTIGAVAVADSDINVLYAGTGESPIRGVTTSHGDGVYKTTDAGKTWTHIGLEKAGQISRIKIHPSKPDIAWVAVQGDIWGPSETRGIFRTTDGGETWEQVLKVNPHTGAADLAMDPSNPRILYAALWHHGRTPWFVTSGGEGGGIYKSTDSGSNWTKLAGGLPELAGKIGVDVSASKPDVVYAIVEALPGEGGLYLSEDGGENWELINETRVIQARAWYYNHITVDPVDEDTLYIQNVPLMKSKDGGKTFERVTTPHSDHHDHWINPDNPLNMINANDGGATITFDGGKTWSSIMNQPTAQFYRVVTDKQLPYRIYGGQQDNTTVAIASATRDGGIGREDYYPVGGGESAHIAFDPDNPRLVYATSINGTLTEYDHLTKLTRSIKPYPEHVYGMFSRDLRYRSNWNAPVITSPHDPGVIYYGTQKLLKSTDRGLSWAEVSPDLTRNDPEKQGLNGGPITPENVGAEFYNTIFYINESVHSEGTIWVGSDDGLVHLTRDGGVNWEDVTPKNAPEGMVNAIEVSPFDPGTAYFALARYKLNDFSPYIYMTTDYGQRWRRIDDGLPDDSFVRVVREDPVRKGLLYAGAESGMFISYDSGENWQSMQMNLPPVPITDLAIRQGNLVAATQGRGFWVLDDLSVLHQMDSDISGKPLHAFTPADARMGQGGGSPGDFEGANPPTGAVLYYRLENDAEQPLTIDILDAEDAIVRSYSSEETDHERCLKSNRDLRRPLKLKYPGTSKGLNTWTWDLRGETLNCIESIRIFAGFSGATVPPGAYQVRFSLGEAQETVQFDVHPDPRVLASEQEIRDWTARKNELTILFNEIMESIDGARKARRQITVLMEDYPDADALQSAGNQANERLSAWEQQVTQLKFETYEDEDSWPSLIDAQVRLLLRTIDNSGPPVTVGALERMADLETEWSGYRSELQAIASQAISAVNAWARDNNVSHVMAPLP